MMTLSRARWLAKGKRMYDDLAKDKVPASPSKRATPTAVMLDNAYQLPSINRTLIGVERIGEDERPVENGHRVGLDERPIVRHYAEEYEETGGRIPLKGNREGSAKYPTPRPKPAAVRMPVIGTNTPIKLRHVRFMTTHGQVGEPHWLLNPRDWLDAHSKNNLLLPADKPCEFCGTTLSCHCYEPCHNPKTCGCDYHVALRHDAERQNPDPKTVR